MHTKKILSSLLVGLLLTLPWTVSARAQANQDASAFIRDLGARAISLLSNKTMSQSEREAALRQIFLADFDVDQIARFALGQYWRTATAAERQRYLALFKEYVVKVYSKALAQAKDTKFTVKSARPAEIAGDTMVVSQVGDADEEPIEVDWRVRQQGSVERVEDVVVDGVSMLITKRQDFRGVMSRGSGGMDALLDGLTQEIAKVQ